MKILLVLLFVLIIPLFGIAQEQKHYSFWQETPSILSSPQFSEVKTKSFHPDPSLLTITVHDAPYLQFGFSGKEINRLTSPEYNMFKYYKDYRTREMINFTNPNKNYPGGDYIYDKANSCSRYWLVRKAVHLFNNTAITIGF